MDYSGESYTDNLIGTLLAIFGNLILSIALCIQKYSHVTLAGSKDHRAFYQTKTWWCGFVFICVGEGANFVSYAFAPLAVVAPLNAVSVLTSSILGFIFLHEKYKAKEFATKHGLTFLGYIFTIGGTYLLVSFGPNSHEKLLATNIVKLIIGWPVLLYLFLLGSVNCTVKMYDPDIQYMGKQITRSTVFLEIVAFCLLLYFYKQRDAKYLIIILLLVALLGSVTVITVKAVAGMLVLTLEGSMQLDYPIFSVMFVCMLASVAFQARFLSQASKLHDSCLVACVNYILSTTFAVGAGAVFYLEFKNDDILHISMFLLGSVLCFLGVFLMTKTKRRNQIFEPYVTMDMTNGVPTIHDKGLAVQPEFTGSFSYGTLVNNDGVAPVSLPVNLEQPTVTQITPDPSNGHPELKKD